MQLHRIEDRINQAGGHLVVVGNGLASFITGFRDKVGFTGALYTDPGRRVYRALELRRGLGTILRVKTFARAIGAFREGHRQTRTLGDAMQEGGVFVIATNGESTFEYRSQFAGDHPSNESLLDGVARAAEISTRSGEQ